MPKTKEKKPKPVTISFEVSPQDSEALRARSKREDRSLSSLLRIAVKRLLASE